MSTQPTRRYFSQRHGRGPVAKPLPYEQFRPLVIHVFDLMRERDYFQEAFGYECVDAGIVHGELGSNPAAFFQRKIMRAGVWPYWDDEPWPHRGSPPEGEDLRQPWERWDEDTLFDMVEVLYDLVSKGTDGEYHDWNDCGWHYGTFDAQAGREEYRAEMNEVLRLHDPPYELTEAGEVVAIGPAELHPLLEAPLPPGVESELEARVTAAVARYRSRDASEDERRHAVLDLIGVLEFVKKDVNAAMLSKDESALFQIANKFGLRHVNEKQQTKYNGPIWLAWMFYVYLATIHAVLRVREQQRAR